MNPKVLQKLYILIPMRFMRAFTGSSPTTSQSFDNSREASLKLCKLKRSDPRPKIPVKKSPCVELDLSFESRSSRPSKPVQKKFSPSVNTTSTVNKKSNQAQINQKNKATKKMKEDPKKADKPITASKAKKSVQQVNKSNKPAKPKITGNSQKKKTIQPPKQVKKVSPSVPKLTKSKEPSRTISQSKKSIVQQKKPNIEKQSKMISTKKKNQTKISPRKESISTKLHQTEKNCFKLSTKTTNSVNNLSTSMQASQPTRMGTRRNPNYETLNITKITEKTFEEIKGKELKRVYNIQFWEKRWFMNNLKRERKLIAKHDESKDEKPRKQVKKDDDTKEWQKILNFTFGEQNQLIQQARKDSFNDSDEWEYEYLEQSKVMEKFGESSDCKQWGQSQETVYQGDDEQDSGLFWS